ncbi:hypothetical protein BDK51DRAFT_26919 [Blyttiomyces helicus]|uniref:F-box domain-containing protein n=1 Tax=Blyttiomyces helicus TaxID=388810 RepID=A0A4P9WHT2_9FUNG|nr:hypothetical protein BDK51DRAFT_26919 [Blyttiomyces helicus]|eukprot:RKO92304.1 hypothetical protein BDK51DRAFT_26919 [Blyttiomyces helicus]
MLLCPGTRRVTCCCKLLFRLGFGLGRKCATQHCSPFAALLTTLGTELFNGKDVEPSPATRNTYIPPELLQQIFVHLPDSRTKGSRCRDLCFATLVCRAWGHAAAARIWTHVVIHMRAALARILDLRFGGWMRGPYCLSVLAPYLRGLRELRVADWITPNDHSGFGPPVSTIVEFPCSCPERVVLSIPAPQTRRGEEWEGSEDGEEQRPPAFDLDAVRNSAGRLKRYQAFWIRWSLDAASFPRIDPASLRNLDTLELLDTASPLFADILIQLWPPLRRPVAHCFMFPTLSTVLTVLPSLPTITHLELTSAHAFPDTTFALLEQHPPLTFLGIHYRDRSPRKPPPEGSFTSEDLQRFLRVRGSNLSME